ncbi:hypothetical protein HOY80DRAFT_860389, partial [Tuber brumale]
WGVMPIHLVELSPPGAGTTIIGTAYQLRKRASSAPRSTKVKIGERFPISEEAG